MKAALFDLDGVLVDTEPTYGIFWGGIGRKYKVGIEDFANVIKGTTLTQILDRYFPDPTIREEVVAALVDYENNMEYPLFSDAIEFLQKLKDAGVKCAIVTSSNLDKMDNLWRKHPELKQYFQVVVTDENVTKSKPDPEPYIVAAKALGCDPAQCVVLEDSFNGLLSGKRAGSKVVGLATTNPRQSLEGKADVIVDSLSEIDIPAVFCD